MKKLEVSKVFEGSFYHETYASEELVEAILSGLQKKQTKHKLWVWILVAILIILVIGFALYTFQDSIFGSTSIVEQQLSPAELQAIQLQREQDYLNDIRQIFRGDTIGTGK